MERTYIQECNYKPEEVYVQVQNNGNCMIDLSVVVDGVEILGMETNQSSIRDLRDSLNRILGDA